MPPRERAKALADWRVLCLLCGLSLLAWVPAWAQSTLVNGSLVVVGTVNHCESVVGTDAYACNLLETITEYNPGSFYSFRADVANLGAATLALNGISGAKTIKKMQGGVTTDLVDNDIRIGQIVVVYYDGTNMQMVSQLGNAPAGVTDGDKTDITVSGTGATWTIDPNVVTYAKMQQVSTTDRFLGRDTPGAGNVEEMSPAAARTMLNLATGQKNLPVTGAKLPATTPAILDRSETNDRLLFDTAVAWCAYWQFPMPNDYAGTPTLRILYTMASATTGSLHFDVALMAVTSGDAADVNTESYATVNDCNDAAVPGTAGFLGDITCALPNDDGVVANDHTKLRLCRDVTNDNAAGHAEVLDVALEYAR